MTDELVHAAEGDAAYEAMISDHEERLATARTNAIAAGRRKAGIAGAAMAGAMLAVSDILDGPKKDDVAVTVEASGDPHDLERDGVDLKVGDVDVHAPALERIEPVVPPSKRFRRR